MGCTCRCPGPLSLMACFLLWEELVGASLTGTVGLWVCAAGISVAWVGQQRMRMWSAVLSESVFALVIARVCSLGRPILGVGAGVAVQGLTAGIKTQ